jgi:hypothetical protein
VVLVPDAYADAKAEFRERYRYFSRANLEAISAGLDAALKFNASIDRERARGALAGVRELLTEEGP